MPFFFSLIQKDTFSQKIEIYSKWSSLQDKSQILKKKSIKMAAAYYWPLSEENL